jgi:hypothetical protein
MKIKVRTGWQHTFPILIKNIWVIYQHTLWNIYTLEADSRSAGEDIVFYVTRSLTYRVHKSPPQVHILRDLKPVHTLLCILILSPHIRSC